MSDLRPPRLAQALLALSLPPGPVREGVLGDLHELYLRRLAGSGGRAWRARMWYRSQALRVGCGYVARRLRRTPQSVRHAWVGRAWVEGVPEHTLADRRGGWRMHVTEALRDVRFAFRSYGRSPGFFAVAMITLALGIGANAAIFSVINGIYLRPLEFEEPERLVRIGFGRTDRPESLDVHTAGSYSYWRERSTSFEGMAAHAFRNVTAEHGDVAETILTVPVVGSLFDVLGVEARIGRTFSADEERAGGNRLAVLSHSYWSQSFGEDPEAVGGTLRLNGIPYTVIGVMPARFTYPHPAAQAWITANLDAASLQAHDDFYLRTVARLAEGRTREQAAEEMAIVAAELAQRNPEVYANRTVPVMSLKDFLVGGSGSLWGALMAGVGLVLLIACLNLANVLMSRAVRRRSEVAVRRALGASRGRLVRQVLTESLVLAALGGALGLGVGWAFLEGILAWMPGGVARVESVRMDGTVMAFTFGTALVAGLVFGCFPAAHMDRGVRGRLGPSRRSGTLLSGLVVAEVGLAVVLLSAGGLAFRSFVALAGEDPGVVMDGRMVFSVKLPDGTPAGESFALYRALEERLAGVAGVRSVGMASSFPVASFSPGAWINVPGVEHADGARPAAKYQVVSPGYFETVGIPLLQGRLLTRDDGLDGSRSVVISRTAAAQLFPGRDPIGRRFDMGVDGGLAPLSTVVGVVGDVRLSGLNEEAPGAVFAVQELVPRWSFGFEVFLHLDPDAPGLAGAVRAAFRDVNAALPFLGLRRAELELSDTLVAQRNTMFLFGLLSVVALAMAAVGVSGVLAFVVSQRTREMGIRMAVGADRGSVRALVLRQGLVPVGIGAALGVGGSLAATRFMQSLLFGVEPTDPVTLAAVTGLLLAVAGVSIYLPAARASRVDPVRVLTAE